MVFSNNLLLGAVSAAAGDYLIEQSLLFDGSTTYLNRTPGTAGNRKTWTLSAWVKRGEISALAENIWSPEQDAANRMFIQWDTGSGITIGNRVVNVTTVWRETSAKFRDPSAWYHIVVAMDTTQATASNRVKVWVNGVQQTAFDTSNDPSLNYDTFTNATITHNLGVYGLGPSAYFDGLIALPQLIDGAALDATSFGELDDDGYWNPIEFAGTTTTQPGSNQVPDMTGPSTPSGTASASANEGGEEPWKAFDQDNVTYWGIIGTAGWVQYDFGASNEQIITSYRIYAEWRPVGSGYGAGPDDWTLEASNTGAFSGEETVLDTVTNEVDGSGQGWKTFTFSNSTAYRYYRLDITQNGGNSRTHIQSFELWDADVETSDSFGTNGFQLDYADTADFGNDTSGNGNDYTPNNFTATDQLSDTPTDSTADEIGNFATLNSVTGTPNWVFSNNNLTVTNASESNHRLAYATQAVTSGTWYWEVTIPSAPNVDSIGVVNMDILKDGVSAYLSTYGAGWGYSTSVGRWDAGGGWVSAGAAPPALTSNGVIGIALDCDNNKLWFRNASGWINSGDPEAGTGANFTRSTTVPVAPAFSKYANTGAYTFNFGQNAFTYTPPTGFNTNFATQNLPAPTIADGSQYFNTVIYAGDSNASGTAREVGFRPDLVWIKSRTASTGSTYNHTLTDSIRGVNSQLYSNSTAAEAGLTNALTSFNDTGFTVAQNVIVNYLGDNYAAWCWKAGGTAVSNTDGSITSSVSANTTSGFSIVSYTGTGVAATIGHGLGSTPKLMIVKNRDAANNWRVYTEALGATKYLNLNTTAAQDTDANQWNNTAPTASVFSVGTAAPTNGSTNGIIAYCWAEVEGFSKFGSYTGNLSTDGPFVYTGFSPAWVMVKRTDTTGIWWIHDSVRESFNPNDSALQAENSNSETANNSTIEIDFLSNGFKLKSANNNQNASGGTYIYAAFAEVPFQGDEGYTQARAR